MERTLMNFSEMTCGSKSPTLKPIPKKFFWAAFRPGHIITLWRNQWQLVSINSPNSRSTSRFKEEKNLICCHVNQNEIYFKMNTFIINESLLTLNFKKGGKSELTLILLLMLMTAVQVQWQLLVDGQETEVWTENRKWEMRGGMKNWENKGIKKW